jgi:hypothetical protein
MDVNEAKHLNRLEDEYRRLKTTVLKAFAAQRPRGAGTGTASIALASSSPSASDEVETVNVTREG